MILATYTACSKQVVTPNSFVEKRYELKIKDNRIKTDKNIFNCNKLKKKCKSVPDNNLAQLGTGGTVEF
jgi:hypothetical protein